MTKIKASDLIGPLLNWAVAKGEGWIDDHNSWLFEATLEEIRDGSYQPSTDWAQGGPLLEREAITIGRFKSTGYWSAFKFDTGDYIIRCTTPLIAAMRCYVAAKLGDEDNEIEIPEELLK